MKSIQERFEDKYEPVTETGCWLWTATTFRYGYGNMKFRGRTEGAHRVSYILHKGEIPLDMCILHSCDTPLCVNPDHLFIGTNLDNTKDMLKKDRANKPTGIRHARFDNKEYTFKHIDGKKYTGTQNSFVSKYSLNPGNVSHIIKGNQLTTKGWGLVEEGL